ncbi:hypothetical protein ACOSQ3_013588 [Xanthoceras sorbifolium]
MEIGPEIGRRKTRWKRLARGDSMVALGQPVIAIGGMRHSEDTCASGSFKEAWGSSSGNIPASVLVFVIRNCSARLHSWEC